MHIGTPKQGLACDSSGEPESYIFGSPEPDLIRYNAFLVHRSQAWLVTAPEPKSCILNSPEPGMARASSGEPV